MNSCKVPPCISSLNHKLQSPTQKTHAIKPDNSTTNRRSSLFLLTLPLANSIISSDSINAFAAEEASIYDPVSKDEKDASLEISRRVSEAVRLLDAGRELQAKGDFAQALLYFTQVIKDYKEFAFTDYARVGRALVLYEIGDRAESIAEMEDVSISLKGYPEIHAALAAALYADKHAPLLAENQFTIATLLDPHYTDISYVKETKHWPPSLVSSLHNFITLS